MRRAAFTTAIVLATLFGSAATAQAQYVEPPPPGGETLSRDAVADPVQVLPSRQVRQDPGSSLPVTGGDVAGLAAIGGVVILAGGAMVAYRRRTEAQRTAAA